MPDLPTMAYDDPLADEIDAMIGSAWRVARRNRSTALEILSRARRRFEEVKGKLSSEDRETLRSDLDAAWEQLADRPGLADGGIVRSGGEILGRTVTAQPVGGGPVRTGIVVGRTASGSWVVEEEDGGVFVAATIEPVEALAEGGMVEGADRIIPWSGPEYREHLGRPGVRGHGWSPRMIGSPVRDEMHLTEHRLWALEGGLGHEHPEDGMRIGFAEGGMVVPEGEIEGIRYRVGREGRVIWSDDWPRLFDLAREGKHGLKIVYGGPETYGDAWVVVGMQEGGIVEGPTTALVGEDGPEAVVPVEGGKAEAMAERMAEAAEEAAEEAEEAAEAAETDEATMRVLRALADLAEEAAEEAEEAAEEAEEAAEEGETAEAVAAAAEAAAHAEEAIEATEAAEDIAPRRRGLARAWWGA